MNPKPWISRRRRRLPKRKNKMNNLKKYLDSFYWYDVPNSELISKIPKNVLDPEYQSNFDTYFGLIPSSHLKIADRFLTHQLYKKFEKFLISNGFDICERGIDNFKYIHYDRKIFMMGDVSDQLKSVDDDDESEYPTLSSDDCIYIGILPTVENRIFIEKIIKGCSKFLIESANEVAKFYLIAQNNQGLFTQKTQFKAIPIKNDRYDLFYGKDFPHDKMKSFISDKTDNLMLLHGDPGTGKSNYIKHLITDCKKKVIYIPPSMLSVLASPSFVSFMMKNKDTILLIEDAEEVLSIERNSATNNLLGLTDGFLKDALNLKVIATFNCAIGKIDPALMRKGRMYFEYKFGELSVEECKELSDFMGMSREVTEPMTLAEFFVQEDNHMVNSFEERRIGFI